MMNTTIKLAVMFTVAVLLLSSGYTLFFTGSPTKTNDTGTHKHQTNETRDTSPPTITSIAGNIMADAGTVVTISAGFSDNVGVTLAKLYYKPASAIAWSSKSILSGSATLLLPPESNESWYYYVTVNDAAGNGPIGDPSTDGSVYYTIQAQYTAPPANDTPPGDKEPNKNQNTTRFVFLELATKLICSQCPKISKIVDDLYNSDTLPFYYVTLPINNPTAMERLTELNQYATPTAYIDGGYKVMYGSSYTPSDFERNISDAAARTTPKISIRTIAQWDNTTKSISVHVHLVNDEATSYIGHVRVYETEVISTTWQANVPEHFSFLEFFINQDVQVAPNDDLYINQTTTTSGLDPDNLMLFSVLFNSQKTTGYSQPPDKNPFDIHPVDAVTATRVVQGGNLPPEVSITSPTVKSVHRFGKPIRASLLGKTVLLGKTTVVASAHDDSKITKVEFYINNKLKATVTSEPYQWIWHSFSLGKRTLAVKAYDDAGKNSSASITVFAVIL